MAENTNQRTEAEFSEFSRTMDVDPQSKIVAPVVASHLVCIEEMVLGIRTVLTLAERSMIESSMHDGRPVLNDYHMGTLMRLAIRAADSVSDTINRFEARHSGR